ncbi:prepilin-type N-terminal cleavage/methylation domain-containing protein [Candidatus Parcubacteria bacterium]|nr:prepilin-type N-terminal cleavage/methylation domain-containing protein [Candidatus Parcubacteria bacterium]
MTTHHTHRGYTLLELIVAVGIFSVVMLAATGAYLQLLRLDRQARITNDLVNNLSFTIDSMARAIRTGTAYKCNNNPGSPNCPVTPGTSFGFNDSETPSRAIVYTRSAAGQIIATINGVAYPLTDPRISVKELSFYVRGVGAGDNVQPQATFFVRGQMAVSATASTTFIIQSSATERFLEL